LLSLTERVRLLLKFCFCANISRLGGLSLLCDLIWHLVPVRGSKAGYFSAVRNTKEINDSSKNSKYPDWGSFPLQIFSAKNAFA
jgi:hypothetical protein